MYQQVYPLGRHFFVLKQKNEAKKIQDYICFPQKIYTGFSKMLKPRFLFINKKLKQKAFLNENSSLFFGSPAKVICLRNKICQFKDIFLSKPEGKPFPNLERLMG